jgi:hypothetical protein
MARAPVALLAVASFGCSTHYQPRPSYRVSVVMDGGNLAYAKNGQTIEHGFLGGGLVEAVEDDPQALEAAETYQGRMTGGFIAHVVGLACIVGGSAYALSSQNEENGFFKSDQGTIFLTALGCWVAGSITGSSLILSAQPYHYDAINIYNDNLEARIRAAPPVTAPLPPPQPQ